MNLIRYIVRRIFISIPTIFGITLVTFVLIHLTPGNPAAIQFGASFSTGDIEDEIYEYSKSYFLHQPLFINLNVEDVRADSERLLRLVKIPEKRDFVKNQIIYRGGAVFPYILPALGRLRDEELDVIISALNRVGSRMGIIREISASPDPVRFWESFWDYYRMDYKLPRARRLVDRYIDEGDELAYGEIIRLDCFALPALMGRLKKEKDVRAQKRLVDLINHMTGGGNIGDQWQSDEELQRQVDSYLRWWWRNEDDFSACEGICRVVGVVTKTQYFHWLERIIHFDFGESLRDHRSIGEKMKERLPVTLLLSFLALVVSYCVSIPVGLISALKVASKLDRTITVILFALYSLPSFWVAIILIKLFCGVGLLEVFPLQGLTSPGSESWPIHARLGDLVHHLVLPVFCLSYVSFATLSRYQRSATVEVFEQEYVRTARAKGLSERAVIMRHVLKNSLIPVITLLGIQIPFLIGGSVIVERIFGIEGMGLETFEAIRTRDYNWILAVTLITAVLTVAGMILADIFYAIVDPRITFGKGRRTI